MNHHVATRKRGTQCRLITGIGHSPVKIEARQPRKRSHAAHDRPNVGQTAKMEHLDDAAADKTAGSENCDFVGHRTSGAAVVMPLSSRPRAISRSSSQGSAMSERWR